MEKLFTDVLIIGSGAAGIRAAVEACKAGVQVFLVNPGKITERGVTFSEISKGWGIQALVGVERTQEKLAEFYNDIVRVGLGCCDPKLARILVEESGPRTDDLMSYGLGFKTGVNGEYIRARGCFSDIRRAFLASDIGNIRKTFLSILQHLPVKIVTGNVTDLISEDGVCGGAWIVQKSGEFLQINAKATVLATGGGNAIFKDHLGNVDTTGAGYALAHLAGAKLINMEFIQFAIGLKRNATRKFLPIAQLNCPHKIVNARGKDVLKNNGLHSFDWDRALQERQKHMPFSSRDSSGLIDIAIAKALQSGTNLYWQNGSSKKTRFEVVLFAHAFNGGVKINENAETTLPRLFAAGEVAAGPHGADRIGGCMMTATQVFGCRAGHFAALQAKKNERHAELKRPPPAYLSFRDQRAARPVSLKIDNIVNNVKTAMSEHAAVIRTEKGLISCQSTLMDCACQLDSIKPVTIAEIGIFCQALLMTTAARLVVAAALSRKKSCGSHYREDTE
jgi:L-aspartate oxidase